MTPFLIGSGALCSIGIGTKQIAASVRTGLSGFAESSIHNRSFAPIRMALLPESALPDLAPAVDAEPLTSRCRRLLRLAAPALQQAAAFVPELAQTPVFLALPEPLPPSPQIELPPSPLPPLSEVFLPLLGTQSQLAFAQKQSQVFPLGRAGALFALEQALALLASGQAPTVIVGGVDTYVDLMLLALLDQERRLLGGEVMDGFIPGEGAAFVVLSTVQPVTTPATIVVAAASALDPGHRYGTEPARGEGLSHALEALRAKLTPSAIPFRCTWAGFNGENFAAKEWGVAQLRHSELFDKAMQLEHPVDCYGDLGAASGAMLLALADHTLRMGTRPGPMLVWASSDREPVACSCLSTTTP